jgi:hypothetical protein
MAIHASWDAILDELESDLIALDQSTAAATPRAGEWAPPSSAPPLPPEFAIRVRRLIEAQRAALDALDKARQSTADHLAAVRAVTATSDSRGAVYLDAQA